MLLCGTYLMEVSKISLSEIDDIFQKLMTIVSGRIIVDMK